MADHVQLKAEPREMLGKKVRRLRRGGVLPATVYGHQVTPQSIQVDAHEFAGVLRHSGRTQLIDLVIGSEKARPVFVKHTAVDAKRHLIQHVEFYQANLTEKMTSQMPLHFVGESPAVHEGGIFLPVLDHVEIECLPNEVPAGGIDVDVSGITDINHIIHAGDLEMPPRVAMLTPVDEVIAKISPPISEADIEAEIAGEDALPAELGGEEEGADAVPES
ncbi:MAG: 50S ribosomal protein L25 [Chloroflexota bacterium]